MENKLIRLAEGLSETIEKQNEYILAQEAFRTVVGLVLLAISAVTFIVWASLPHKEPDKANAADA